MVQGIVQGSAATIISSKDDVFTNNNPSICSVACELMNQGCSTSNSNSGITLGAGPDFAVSAD